MREPSFWWREAGPAAGLLAPLGAIYGAVAARRMARKGARAGVPVLCVGNFTLGGAGKTPMVIALARMLEAAGAHPFCLTRGYGGSERGPRLVDPQTDGAPEVGDEALLLAHVAPTIVARDRVAGARLAQQSGADVVVMDDGLQNGALEKDFTLAVIDGRRGIGNARMFPAGPLRAPLEAQLARTNALLVVGEDTSGARDVLAAAADRGLPVFHGRLVPDQAAIAALKGRKVLAFAGIGDPAKFFISVADAGLDLAEQVAFPDHHRFTAEEAAGLLMQAEHGGLELVTTEKDRARMVGEPSLAALATRTHVLPVRMEVIEADTLRGVLTRALGRD
ncbi:MAG: tetraacyldisaccharide 4'-kinase [Pseudolabrys sp.]